MAKPHYIAKTCGGREAGEAEREKRKRKREGKRKQRRKKGRELLKKMNMEEPSCVESHRQVGSDRLKLNEPLASLVASHAATLKFPKPTDVILVGFSPLYHWNYLIPQLLKLY